MCTRKKIQCFNCVIVKKSRIIVKERRGEGGEMKVFNAILSHLAFNLPTCSCAAFPLFSFCLQIQFQNSIFFQQCLMLSISLEKITCFISIQFEMESNGRKGGDEGERVESKEKKKERCIAKYLLLSTILLRCILAVNFYQNF